MAQNTISWGWWRQVNTPISRLHKLEHGHDQENRFRSRQSNPDSSPEAGPAQVASQLPTNRPEHGILGGLLDGRLLGFFNPRYQDFFPGRVLQENFWSADQRGPVQNLKT